MYFSVIIIGAVQIISHGHELAFQSKKENALLSGHVLFSLDTFCLINNTPQPPLWPYQGLQTSPVHLDFSKWDHHIPQVLFWFSVVLQWGRFLTSKTKDQSLISHILF